MISYNTIRDLNKVNVNIGSTILKVIAEYYNPINDSGSVLDAKLDWYLGGEVLIINNREDYEEMLSTCGYLPDVVVSYPYGMSSVFYATNNSGGPTFFVDSALLTSLLSQESGVTQDNFRGYTE
jgi:hypothetical protein